MTNATIQKALGATLLAAAVMTPLTSGAALAGSPPVTDAETATHLLALQGTALALASETFQNVLIGALAQNATGPFTCAPDASGAGSSLINSLTHPDATTTDLAFSYYFDKACTQTFAHATMTFVKRSTTVSSGPGQVTYFDTTGTAQGKINLQMRFFFDTATGQINLGGAGRYTPKSGTPPLGLAVNCKHIEHVFAGKPMLCQVVAAQDFPALGKQLAFTSAVSQKLSGTISFHSISSDLVTAAPGALTAGFVAGNTVGLTGTSTPFGTTAIKGKIGAFSIFPPLPTAWTVSDAAHQQTFSIRVVSDAVRNASGTVVDTSSASNLAVIAVDKSGTGTIRYAGKPAAAVTNWVLSK